jgi:hypothetical protein
MVLATSACLRSVRYLARKVSADEVVGSWVLTEAALTDLKDIGHTKHLALNDQRLVIHAGGTCFYQGWIEPSAIPENDAGFVSTDCRWTLKAIDHQAIVVEFPKQDRSLIFYFAEEDGQLVLWKYLDDPDSENYLEFVKHK